MKNQKRKLPVSLVNNNGFTIISSSVIPSGEARFSARGGPAPGGRVATTGIQSQNTGFPRIKRLCHNSVRGEPVEP